MEADQEILGEEDLGPTPASEVHLSAEELEILGPLIKALVNLAMSEERAAKNAKAADLPT